MLGKVPLCVPTVFHYKTEDNHCASLLCVHILSTCCICITPSLDGYLSHLDRTPHTQTMKSLNICGMVLYNTQNSYSHTSLLPQSGQFASICLIFFHPSQPPMNHIIGSFSLSSAEHTHVSWPQPNVAPIIADRRCKMRRKVRQMRF